MAVRRAGKVGGRNGVSGLTAVGRMHDHRPPPHRLTMTRAGRPRQSGMGIYRGVCSCLKWTGRGTAEELRAQHADHVQKIARRRRQSHAS
jgi:hypothetical protein